MLIYLAIFSTVVLFVLYYKSIFRMSLALLYVYLVKQACDHLRGFQFFDAFSTLFGVAVLVAAALLLNLFEDPPEADENPEVSVPLGVSHREIPDAECERSKSLKRGNNFFI